MRDAAVMLIVKDGLILSISRRNDKTKFGLPGGKVEPNESICAGAIRETLEETGVLVTNCELIFQRNEPKDSPDGEDFNCYCYYATDWSGEAVDSEEGKVVWLSEEELIGPMGAFPDYNRRTLEGFKVKFPNVFLHTKRCD